MYRYVRIETGCQSLAKTLIGSRADLWQNIVRYWETLALVHCMVFSSHLQMNLHLLPHDPYKYNTNNDNNSCFSNRV